MRVKSKFRVTSIDRIVLRMMLFFFSIPVSPASPRTGVKQYAPQGPACPDSH